MSDESVITLESVSKYYRVYFEKPALVKSILPFLLAQGKAQRFCALCDVNVIVKKSECIGIIGPNGSGKSTMLSILAGVTQQTEGRAEIRGKVSSLLSLGAGFHPELTGRENIYLNAAILGMSMKQIDIIFDDIVNFAEIGKFINAKLSTYSAGMNMRLGFAIATAVPFDILLIDEVLAVGDMAFQRKCFKRMKEFYEDEGKTIVMVSHDLETLRGMCDRVLWFEHGAIEAIGNTNEVLGRYIERYRDKYSDVEAGLKKVEVKEPKRPMITVDCGREIRVIPKDLFGIGIDWVDDGHSLLEEKGRRLNEYMVSRLGLLEPAFLQFPGEWGADTYHWQNGIGRERSPIPYPLSERGLYPDFGTDEMIELCRKLNAPSALMLNVATAGEDEVIDWLRYLKEKGCAPRFIEFGCNINFNELSVLGRIVHLSVREYARKVVLYAEAVRSLLPEAAIGVPAYIDTGDFKRYRDGDWNRAVVERAAHAIDYLAVRSLVAPVVEIARGYCCPMADEAFKAILGAAEFNRKMLEELADCINSAGKKNRLFVAVGPYGSLFDYFPEVIDGRRVSFRPTEGEIRSRSRTLGAALYDATILNLLIKTEDIKLAAKPLRLGPHRSAFYTMYPHRLVENPLYHVWRLYRRLAGHTLVHSECSNVDYYDAEAVGIIPPLSNVAILDAIAVKSTTGDKLAIYIVNRALEHTIQVEINLNGFPARQITQKFLTADSIVGSNTDTEPFRVNVGEWTRTMAEVADPKTGKVAVRLPKHSLSVIFFDRNVWL